MKEKDDLNTIEGFYTSSLLGAILWGLLLLGYLLLSGCVLSGFGLTPEQAVKLTPEQIQAFKDQDMKVWNCFRLGGPPPVGNSMFILVPKDSTIQYKFNSDCAPQ
jgi:hypothetical protein